MGKGLLDRLCNEYELEVTWLGYELHPRTPPAGVPLADRFPGSDVEAMYAPIRARAEELGLEFGRMEVLPNSRLALEAAEYARDRGCFDEFHEGMFRAYFAQGQNIGRFRVVAAIAEQCGLDPTALKTVLESRIYAPRLDTVRQEAHAYGIRGIPLFLLGGSLKIEGARSLDDFRYALDTVLGGGRNEERNA